MEYKRELKFSNAPVIFTAIIYLFYGLKMVKIKSLINLNYEIFLYYPRFFKNQQ